MANTYQIIPLLNGAVFSTLEHILLKQARPLRRPLSEVTPCLPMGDIFDDIASVSPGLWVPVVVWLLLGPGAPILIDTGLASCQELRESVIAHSGEAIPCHQKPEWRLDRQLSNYGLTPDDIHEVILTHLHGDHIGNNEMFPNARFYAHQDEIPFCLNPPKWAPFYRPDNAKHLQVVMDRLQVLSDDYQLHSGVRLLHLGGHSPGLMAVLIDTMRDRVAIASDLIHSYENLELDWPIGGYWDLNLVMQGMDRLRRQADIILPNHDWEIWNRYPLGSIG